MNRPSGSQLSSTLSFLEQDSVQVARQLIGWRFYRLENGQRLGGTIVETEAYNQMDAASHSFKGKTPRTEVMFGPAGYLYVYFTYGMHYCVNIVAGPDGFGEAVLLRAIEPDAGLDVMRQRRNHRPDSQLTDGPAKLCQALGITKDQNGQQLGTGDFELLPPRRPTPNIVVTKRIGISKDTHRLWRFVRPKS